MLETVNDPETSSGHDSGKKKNFCETIKTGRNNNFYFILDLE
jgi:hypothetical protein